MSHLRILFYESIELWIRLVIFNIYIFMNSMCFPYPLKYFMAVATLIAANLVAAIQFLRRKKIFVKNDFVLKSFALLYPMLLNSSWCIRLCFQLMNSLSIFFDQLLGIHSSAVHYLYSISFTVILLAPLLCGRITEIIHDYFFLRCIDARHSMEEIKYVNIVHHFKRFWYQILERILDFITIFQNKRIEFKTGCIFTINYQLSPTLTGFILTVTNKSICVFVEITKSIIKLKANLECQCQCSN